MIRTVKDHLIRCGGQKNVNIDFALLQSCKSARAKYVKYLEDKNKQEAAEKKQNEQQVYN